MHGENIADQHSTELTQWDSIGKEVSFAGDAKEHFASETATMPEENKEKAEQTLSAETAAIDWDIQQDLSSIKKLLKGTLSDDLYEAAISSINSDIVTGKYREAYKSKKTGEILFGDEALRTRAQERVVATPEGRRKINIKIEQLGPENTKFLMDTAYLFNAATYNLEHDELIGSIDHEDEIAMSLHDRIDSNIMSGYFDGMSIDGDSIADAPFWPTEATHAQLRKKDLIGSDFFKGHPEDLEKVSKEYEYLRNNNPAVYTYIRELTQRIEQVAGNDIEALAANDLISGYVQAGEYRTAYIDEKGFLRKSKDKEQ